MSDNISSSSSPQPPPQQPTPNRPSPEQQQKEKFNDLHYHYTYHHHDHWFGNLFWGLLIIIVGMVFLSRSLGFLPGLDWGQFWSHIWPVFIIVAGLSIMSRGGIIARIISIILMLIILGFFTLWLFQIPVHGKIGDRIYNFDPTTMNNWMNQPAYK